MAWTKTHLLMRGRRSIHDGMCAEYVFPLVVLALTSACAVSTQAPTPGPRPTFSAYRAGAPRPVTLTAPYAGYLTHQGPCLGLTIGGRFATVIWPETARLSSTAVVSCLPISVAGPRCGLATISKGLAVRCRRARPTISGRRP
jgi:hypothetical protein